MISHFRPSFERLGALFIALSLGLGLAACLPAPAGAVAAYGARHPSLSPDGSRIAFSWRGDLWVVAAEGGPARRLTDHKAYDHTPRWSPDGREIAFSSDRNGNNDLFVVAAEGGEPERLTFHSDDDFLYDWSPDGKTLYFGSSREALSPLVYAVPRSGGRAVRVIADSSYNARISPDGRWIAYVRGYNDWWRKNYRGPASRDLWVRALAGGPSFHLSSWPGNDDRPHWSADGRSLLFQSERDDGVVNLWRQDLRIEGDEAEPAGPAFEITHLTGDGLRYLDVSRDGRWAAFESEGWIWISAVSGYEPHRIEIDCAGDFKENDLERSILSSGATEFAYAPGEKDVAFVVSGEIYAAPIKEGKMKEPIRLTQTDAREKDLAWLDEKTLIYASDRHGNDDLFLVRSTDSAEPRLGKSRYREEIRLTDDPSTEYKPNVSPDGKTILYRKGNGFVWTMKPDGSAQKLLFDEPQILHTDWSPDSRYVAFSITTLGHAEDIHIYDVQKGGAPVNVSNHPNDDFHPLWTEDGKRLSWASRTDEGFYTLKYLWLTREEADKSKAEREREEDAKEEDDKKADEKKDDSKSDKKKEEKPPVEVRIDWDDLSDRIRNVATVRGYYWDYDQSPDGKHYALRTDVLENEMELWTVDWDGDHLRRLTQGGANPDLMLWSEDSEKVRYISEGLIKEIKNEPDAEATELEFSVELSVDARARRLQKFNEAWRLLNDGFYDEHFHGVDWAAMRAKYEPLASEAVMYADFKDVLREMIGELNASHLGTYGGPRETDGNDETGLLGFTPDDAYTGPGVRVKEVLPRGPLDREGRRVEPGKIIMAIDGARIAAGAEYYSMLNHKAGKEVDLLVAGAGGKERKVTVEPSAGVWDLAYRHWMDENRGLVDRLSDGQLGYVHMSAMGEDDWDKFIADVFSRAKGKKGLILDVRFNNGGSIHDQVLTFLSRKPYVYTRSRGDREISYDALWRWDGPIVVLTNERSYSDGEIFPAGFKALGLGRIVGMPTFGAVIGTNDVELIDGTGFRVPSTGWWRLDGCSLENDPVLPDVLVPDVPEEEVQGRDAQIEAGVAECLRMLEKK